MAHKVAKGMTPNTFRDFSLCRFQIRAKKKYDVGQEEHGGKVFERVAFRDLEDEIIDLWHYVQALRVKLGMLEDEDE